MNKQPHVTPRKEHDLNRARELVRGILWELNDPYAFEKGPQQTDCTTELFDWTYELRSILSLYEPHSIEEDELLDDE